MSGRGSGSGRGSRSGNGTKSECAAPLASVFLLHTVLFRNCLVSIDEVDATARLNSNVNSIGFIAAHLVDTRCWMTRYLGLEQPEPFGGMLKHGTSIETLKQLPALGEVRLAWDQVSATLERRLGALTEEELEAPSSQKLPGVPPTVHGGLAFLLHHESYHIGQLAFLRKYLGLPAMSYQA